MLSVQNVLNAKPCVLLPCGCLCSATHHCINNRWEVPAVLTSVQKTEFLLRSIVPNEALDAAVCLCTLDIIFIVSITICFIVLVDSTELIQDTRNSLINKGFL